MIELPFRKIFTINIYKVTFVGTFRNTTVHRNLSYFLDKQKDGWTDKRRSSYLDVEICTVVTYRVWKRFERECTIFAEFWKFKVCWPLKGSGRRIKVLISRHFLRLAVDFLLYLMSCYFAKNANETKSIFIYAHTKCHKTGL